MTELTLFDMPTLAPSPKPATRIYDTRELQITITASADGFYKAGLVQLTIAERAAVIRGWKQANNRPPLTEGEMTNREMTDGEKVEAVYIARLMKDNSDALGFMPEAGIRRHVAGGCYLVASDHCGRPVGFLMHTPLKRGRLVRVSMQCVEKCQRSKGYGSRLWQAFAEQAADAQCLGITLKCAADLAANAFWVAQGLELVVVQHRENRRARAVNVYYLGLRPPL